MPCRDAPAGARTYYSHLAPLVTAPKFEGPWRPAPLPPVGLSDLQRVLAGLKNLDRHPHPRATGHGSLARVREQPSQDHQGVEVNTVLSEIEFDAAAEALHSVGYAIVHTRGDEEALTSAVHSLGRAVGALSFGYVHLRATDSGVWLGRHTESLTDGPTPLRYFALGCFVPAVQGGATHLYDGSQAARLLPELLPGSAEVFIKYRSAYRPEVSDHPLIVGHERYGQVLRFRSASEYNTVITKPVGLSETDLYAAVEEALSASLAYVHRWRAGDLLIVDNHRMLHSRAPFAGLRHMLRVRYDDPLNPTVSLEG